MNEASVLQLELKERYGIECNVRMHFRSHEVWIYPGVGALAEKMGGALFMVIAELFEKYTIEFFSQKNKPVIIIA